MNRQYRLYKKFNVQALVLLVLFNLMNCGTVYGGELSGKAPNFTLLNGQGSKESLSDHIGEVVMLNFWASWCGPCRQEMPLLEALYNKYQMLGFTVLGVNVEEDSDKAKALLKTMPISFPILFDNQNEVSEQMNVDAMPTTLLIDRNGNRRFLHRGYKPGFEEHYEQNIKTLLRE